MPKLFHFSEDPSISCFVPRSHPSHPTLAPAVWAIDEERAPMYFLPRDCPRIAYYPCAETSGEDVKRFFGDTSARMVIAVESRWYSRMRETSLYRYSFPLESFQRWDEGAGYYISHEPVCPEEVQPIGDLLSQLCASGVELRLTPSLFPLQKALLSSTLHVSMIRMRNAVHE